MRQLVVTVAYQRQVEQIGLMLLQVDGTILKRIHLKRAPILYNKENN
jgi:hypothetical protein